MDLIMSKVLCAVDLSPAAAILVRFAASLSGRYLATMLVFHALYPTPDTFLVSDDLALKHPSAQEAERARRRLESLLANCRGSGRIVLARGEPVEEAVRAVGKHGVDFMLVQRQSLPAMRKVFRWTLIERLARRVDIPLLILPPAGEADPGSLEPAHTFRRIVLACGPRPRDKQALRLALGLARDFAARLYLFHAMESPVDEQLVDPTEAPYWRVQSRLKDKLRRKLTALAEPLRDSPVELDTELRTGPAAEAICEFADTSGATLVVVGARRHGKLGKLLLGSTTEAVLRNAPCAVLVAPDQSRKSDAP